MKTHTFSTPGSQLEAKAARIVLIDDHMILREGLRELLNLESDFEVVGEASSALEGRALTLRTTPDLVITDLSTPGSFSVSVVADIKAAHDGIRVLVLSGHCTDEHVRAALEAGADGFIVKDAGRAELVEGVRAVLSGRQYLSEPVATQVISGYLGQPESSKRTGIDNLTEREREVLGLVARASSTKQIAIDLGLSPKTVEKHRSNMMRKLKLHNSSAVTLYAIKNKLLDLDE